MSEGLPQPTSVPEPATPVQETSHPESAVGFITSLVQQRNEAARSQSEEVKLYNTLMDLRLEASPQEWHIERNPLIDPARIDTIAHVFTGYGSLIFDRLPANKQAIFLNDARTEQEARGGTDLQLTEEEGQILKNVAHSVGVEYDPGTAESPEKRTFQLADIEKRAPDPSKVDPQFNFLLDPNFRF